MDKKVETLDSVVVRFAGDSGDGMQLTGTQFTETTALVGNDIATFPDYPAEIRAPAGTVAGVSGFQIMFSSQEVFTPGDAPDVLVAMNAAALKVNLPDVKRGGTLIVNTAGFDKKNLEKAGYAKSPLDDGSLSAFRVITVDVTGLTLKALEGTKLGRKAAERSKNFFALGLVYWMFNRPLEHTFEWIDAKFGKKNPDVAEANIAALKAGHNFGENAEVFSHSFVVPPASIPPGKYKNLSGNEATAIGLVTASQLAGLDLFLGTYPITPASDILHHLATLRHFGVTCFQAEDEIAGVASAIGAAYGGALAATTTSGPGLALKGEGLGLAVMMELPLVAVDVQRGGPSTGLPTKTEQADLLQAIFGRHGESPIPVIAPCTPADCFWGALEAARIAIKHMTPVLLLTDGYLANGVEPFKIPDVESLPKIPVSFRTDPNGFFPYERDEHLARPWALPGTPGLEHRIGGLEKDARTGGVSYDGVNHEKMIHTRAAKVQKVAEGYAPSEVHGDQDGELLFVGWGSTFGSIRQAVRTLRQQGHKVGHLHLRNLNPLPNDLGDVFKRFGKVLVPELNLGQLAFLLRGKLLIDVQSFTKVQGKPFKESELLDAAAPFLTSTKTAGANAAAQH
jgi:2-oxoglutarate ferredoxin oxidoreductase subunit alpha